MPAKKKKEAIEGGGAVKESVEKKGAKKVKIVAQSTLKKGTAIIKNIVAPKKIFAKSKTAAKGFTSKVPALKSKKVLALITMFIIIVAAVASIAIYYPGMAGGGQGPDGPPTNETPPQPHAPYHSEYDTPAMSGATPGGIGVYQYVENKFPVDANATKLTAKLTVKDKIGPRLEIHYILKDAKGKVLKNLLITSESGGTIDITNATLASSGAGQYTSRVEVYKGIQVVSHVVIDVAYPDVNATKPK